MQQFDKTAKLPEGTMLPTTSIMFGQDRPLDITYYPREREIAADFIELQNRTSKLLSEKYPDLPETTLSVVQEEKGIFRKSIFTTLTFETKFTDSASLIHQLTLKRPNSEHRSPISEVAEHVMWATCQNSLNGEGEDIVFIDQNKKDVSFDSMNKESLKNLYSNLEALIKERKEAIDEMGELIIPLQALKAPLRDKAM